MGLWFFLSEWFADIPTHGVLFKRIMINRAWAIGLLVVLMIVEAPAQIAAVVFFGVIVVNGAMALVYLQQRVRRR